MKRLAYALALVPSLAFAQAAPAPADPAQDFIADYQTEIGSRSHTQKSAQALLDAYQSSRKELEAAKKELAELKAKLEAPKDAAKDAPH